MARRRLIAAGLVAAGLAARGTAYAGSSQTLWWDHPLGAPNRAASRPAPTVPLAPTTTVTPINVLTFSAGGAAGAMVQYGPAGTSTLPNPLNPPNEPQYTTTGPGSWTLTVVAQQGDYYAVDILDPTEAPAPCQISNGPAVLVQHSSTIPGLSSTPGLPTISNCEVTWDGNAWTVVTP